MTASTAIATVKWSICLWLRLEYYFSFESLCYPLQTISLLDLAQAQAIEFYFPGLEASLFI